MYYTNVSIVSIVLNNKWIQTKKQYKNEKNTIQQFFNFDFYLFDVPNNNISYLQILFYHCF